MKKRSVDEVEYEMHKQWAVDTIHCNQALVSVYSSNGTIAI